jgi:hypothetical protein
MSVAELATSRDIERLENRIDKLDLKIQAELAPLKWGIGVCVVCVLYPIIKSLF